MASVTDFLNGLEVRLKTSDIQGARDLIDQLDQWTRDPDGGAQAVNWISQPVNLTQVHQTLVDRFSVPPRAMAIRRMNYTRPRRAQLLIQAIRVALQRVQVK